MTQNPHLAAPSSAESATDSATPSERELPVARGVRFNAMLGRSAATDHGTPRDLFDRWNRQFAFTVDAAAEPRNALLPRFWTPAIDGAAQNWSGERVWCNPPYGSGLLLPFVRRAAMREADVAVLFLPVRTGARWWREFVEPHAFIRWLPFRVKFNGQPNCAPFDSCLAVYYPSDARAAA